MVDRGICCRGNNGSVIYSNFTFVAAVAVTGNSALFACYGNGAVDFQFNTVCIGTEYRYTVAVIG